VDGLKKLNSNLENELVQERLQSQHLLEEMRVIRENANGVALASRIDKIISLFCKRDL